MQIKHIAEFLSIGALALIVTCCSTTEQARSVTTSGFLGDYSQLTPGKSGQAKLVYIDLAADFSKYNKIMLEPVQLWQSENPDSPLSKLSKEEQQQLINYLYASLEEKLSMDYSLVDQPGPGVLRVRAAITEASKSKPVTGLVSSVTPIGIGLSYTKKLATGSHTGVGSVGAEAELLDGATGQRVAAAVDRRVGGKALYGEFGVWGDVKEACDHWAHRLQMRLAELRNKQP